MADLQLGGFPAVEGPAVARGSFRLYTRRWTVGLITILAPRGGLCGNQEGIVRGEKVGSEEFSAICSRFLGD